MAKRSKIRLFVSYAHADDQYADPFLKSLMGMLKPSRAYEFELWRDTGILPGEDWLKEIEEALAKCRLGILLVSPEFLGSEFITEKELPEFIDCKAKPVVPVMLRKVNLKRHDLKGLSDSQIYRFKAGSNNYRSYAQCGSEQRDDFIYDLHDKIEQRLEKALAGDT